MPKSPSKVVAAKDNNVVERVSTLHTEINTLSAELKEKKAEFVEVTDKLKEDSLEVFNRDLGAIKDATTPSIYGNHEYTVDKENFITVNYKTKPGGLTFTQISGRPARDVLTKLMDEKEYKKLFKEKTKLNESDEKLEEVNTYSPSLVGHKLNVNSLPEEALEELRDKYPESFTPYIKDEAEYIKEVEDANIETEVITNTGFLEKVSSLDEDTQYRIRDLTRKVLSTVTTSAVKCGNKIDVKLH
jgi:hypothetical protein